MEFFFAIMIIFGPDLAPVAFETMVFKTHAECAGMIATLDDELKTALPPGADVRLSCVSSNSIGQNGV